jgi:AsmA protein
MKRPRLGPCRLVLLGFLLLPPLVWGLVLVLVPTEWARARVVARLGALTGRPVRLEALRVGLLGGIRLTHLEIGAPGSAHDPWLKVDEARTSISLLQLLSGRVGPSQILIDGLSLRILRRSDGTLELADLIPTEPRPADGQRRREPEDTACSVAEVTLRDARIQIIDEPTRTTLEFSKVEGRGEKKGRCVRVQELHGLLNGGPFELTAQLDGSSTTPAFEGHARTHDVALSGGMRVLCYLVPILAGAPDHLEGKLDLDLYVRGQGDSQETIQRSLVGRGAVSVDPVQLEGSRFLSELASLVDLPPQEWTSSVKGGFVIDNGRVSTNKMVLNVAKVPITLAGWTDFDGRLAYRVRTESLTRRLPGEARDLLSELSIDLDKLTAFDIRGSIDDLVFTIDGAPLNVRRGDPARRDDEQQRILEFTRKLRDRLLR